ncbi:hypothetical protein ASE48_08575 [Mycobacterium sp. Root265]|uniref:hypothetical protein n=1 Tax=Mycobacterium sp. Root265 TaxID=1736504 RepID=UPI00070EA57A|nr:hypothetical protein [Mycobacterium sp. Root265]KRD08609.1 hypothetical protein ASE48_08575 [Mycobacterium sp. Root265]
MTKIAATALLETVLELGKETPDQKAGCTYFNDDSTPCCIVGHGFAKHGFGADTLSVLGDTYHRRWASLNHSTGVTHHFIKDHVVSVHNDADDKALSALADIQNKQDRGATWAEAVDPSITYTAIVAKYDQ